MNKESIIKYIKQNPQLYKKIIHFNSLFQRSKRKNRLIRSAINVVLGKKIISLGADSILNYQKFHNKTVHIIEPEQMRNVYIPRNVPKRNSDYIERVRTPAVFCTKIEDASVIGESNAVITNDGFYLNDKLLLEYSDEINYAVGPVFEFTGDKCTVEVDNNPQFIEEGVYLIGEGSNNYYHWVFDILSKVIYLNQLDDYREIPLLIDETVARHPTCIEMLDKIDLYRHPRMFLKRGGTYNVKSLIYISPTTWSTVYQNSDVKTFSLGRYAKSQYVIDMYRSIILKQCETEDPALPKRLFITRGSDKKKRLVNEQELCDISAKYGFIPYDPAAETIDMQVKHFNNADCIIGASGAAFVNVMWCKKGCKVICVSPMAYSDYNYSTLAHIVGAECIYVDGKMIDELYHTVDVNVFENALAKFLEL